MKRIKKENLTVLNKKFLGFFEDLKIKFPQAEIFLVGGAVRDLFLGRQTLDYDFVIRKVSLKNLEKFFTQQGKVNLVGQLFGVFKFVPPQGDKKNPFDIALPRRDFSWGTGGYRDVEIQTNPRLSIKSDLSRRDFTINALALKWQGFNQKGIAQWELIDPFNGQKDLAQKIIRTVGAPEKRFKEDYSRILRALRFSCQLDFKIEENTWKTIKEKVKFLNKIERTVDSVQKGKIVESRVIEKRVVPYETVAKEVLKSFSFNPVKAFDLYDQSGAFQELIPEVLTMKNCPQPENYHTEGDVWQHTRLALKNINSNEFKKYFGPEPASLEVIMAVFLHDLGKPYTIKTPEKDKTDRIRFDDHDNVGAAKAREISQRLKLSSPDKYGLNVEEVVWLVKQHMILIRGEIKKMKAKTIAKYFFNPRFSGKKLLQVSFIDIKATITKKGPLSLDKFKEMVERIEELKQMSKNKKNLPETLISGDDLIKRFNLKPGPVIGTVLRKIREEQLDKKIKTKEQALVRAGEIIKKENYF